MSEAWPKQQLENMVQSDSPITYGVVKPGPEGDIPFVRGGDLRDGEVLVSQLRTITSEVSEQYRRTLLKGGELLVCLVGVPGQVGIVPDSLASANIARQVGLVRLVEDVDVQFVSYFLLSPLGKEGLGGYTGGAVQQVINLRDLKKVKIPLPPLPEQKRIVSILDEAFGAIERAKENAQKNLANARELFESYLNRVFTEKGEGWEERSLADLGVADRVITYGVIKLGDAVPDGVPCLRTSNVKKLHIDLDGMKRIARSLSEDYARTILQGGEVLVNVRGTLGGVAVVPPEMIGWNVSREVAVVPVNIESIDPSFVALWIAAKNQQDWLTGVKNGAAYTGINIEDLRRLPVCFPNEREQQSLVRLIEAAKTNCSNLASDYQQKLAALDELKQSILQKAFAGKLTAKSPELEAVP